MVLKKSELDMAADSFLFAGVPRARLEQLLAQPGCSVRTALRGEAIFTPTRYEMGIALLVKGSVLVTKGRLVMSLLTAGDVFGAATLFNRTEEYVTTLTARSAVRYLFLTGERVEQLLKEEQQVMLNYVAYLTRRIRFLSERVDALGAGSGTEKVYTWLLDHAGEDRVVHSDLSMTRLAESLSMGRASLYRALDELEARGVIQREGRTIRVLR